jgi:MarR family transcriptional regulator, transcriptional regulator for hemolysin
MGMSQAKWRTLMHLAVAPGTLTQTEIAARLGIEEPTLVSLLHRLEGGGWIKRRSSALDRRCKIVDLGPRAQRVIVKINATATKLRRELLSDISDSELRTCMKVLERVHQRAEELPSGEERSAKTRSTNGQNEKLKNGNRKAHK